MNNNSSGGQSSKPDRKTIEKQRRTNMKALCSKLASIIPRHMFKETVTQQGLLDLAAAYIKHLTERMERLKKMKEEAMKSIEPSGSIMETATAPVCLSSPVFELRDFGSAIELVLITGLNRNFMLYQVISILEQEGAEVAKLARVGVETTRVCQRLQELI
ncbi:hypothetical protein V6N13_017051 [Hibiscus sabdariffa]|uniref:BHLH domain-containing protein n=1 Tax=Hibiscus sabdariffa TaxID=183260 RepID=A0ABR2CY64_9ROSI